MGGGAGGQGMDPRADWPKNQLGELDTRTPSTILLKKGSLYSRDWVFRRFESKKNIFLHMFSHFLGLA